MNQTNSMWSLITVLSLQWGLQVPFPQQKLTSLQYTPSPGPAVSLRRWSPVGERHGDIHSVGQRLGAHRLEGLPQDPERGCAAARDAVGYLQGWTLVQSWRSCGEAAGQKATRSERQMRRRGTALRLCFSPICATPLTCSVSFNLGFGFFKSC